MLGYRDDRREHQFRSALAGGCMHAFGLIFFGLIAVFWAGRGLRVALGTLRLPWLKDCAPAGDENCPRVSLLVAARDEEEKLPTALSTLLAIDYPHLEIVAVDDRSSDRTGQILKEAAAGDARLKVVHVENLPGGWLGKPHALQCAFAASTGEWLLFTDADVRFRADTVRRAIALVNAGQIDHLTLLCEVEMHGFWERTALTFFGLAFHLVNDPGTTQVARSRAYVGVGAFQLVRRKAYEASGTHRRLAMEVLDDMKLGKIVKQAGFRSCVGIAQDFVTVRWHSGLKKIVDGVTKNFFAATGFSVARAATQVSGLVCTSIVPFFAWPFVRGWMLGLVVASLVIALGFHAAAAAVMRASPWFALTQPIGAAIFAYMLLRSTAVTLRQGGIVWRETFYPLDELRKGLV